MKKAMVLVAQPLRAVRGRLRGKSLRSRGLPPTPGWRPEKGAPLARNPAKLRRQNACEADRAAAERHKG